MKATVSDVNEVACIFICTLVEQWLFNSQT